MVVQVDDCRKTQYSSSLASFTIFLLLLPFLFLLFPFFGKKKIDEAPFSKKRLYAPTLISLRKADSAQAI